MGRLVVDVACLAAVVLSGAHGQVFGHFSTAPQPTPSPKESMITRAVQQQLALQTGACASEWADHFSSQCPAGAFMALKGFKTTVGLVPVFRCEPTGCLHAPPGQGENIYNLRDEGTIMKDGVAREISMLMEEQPGVSFEKHLAARRKKFGKEGAMVEGTLSALLREASLGQPTATTLRFFAELAGYRGFAGAVVEEAWSYLEKYHREETYHQREAKTQAQIITRQEATIKNLQAELAEERKAKAVLGMQVKAAEKATAEARSEVDACLDESKKESEGIRVSFSAMMKQQQEISAEKVAEMATQLADVRQLLAEESTATAAAAITMETVNAHSEAVRVEARAALEKAADTEVALLANVSSALEGQKAATSELAAVREQLLAEEIKQRKIVFAMSESVDTCHHSLDAKAGTIEKLKRELKDERTGENAQRGWRLARTKIMDDLDACTVRARERLVLFDENIEELKGAADKMDAAITVLVSLQKEGDTCGEKLDMCDEQLASLPSSNDQCNCAGTEVPATVGGGNDSVSGAPAP